MYLYWLWTSRSVNRCVLVYLCVLWYTDVRVTCGWPESPVSSLILEGQNPQNYAESKRLVSTTAKDHLQVERHRRNRPASGSQERVGHFRRKRFSDFEYQEPRIIEVPKNAAFAETLLFWDALICPAKPVCDSSYSRNHTHRCGPYWCESCSCRNCDKRKDCCVDSYLKDETNGKVSHMTCRPGSPNVPEEFKVGEKWYYFIDSCPDSYHNPTVKLNCETKHGALKSSELPLRLPVYSLTSQLNYFNTFCAQCHGDDGSLKIWDPQVRCSFVIDFSKIKSQADLVTFLLGDERCFVTSSPPQGIEVYECAVDKNLIRSCNASGDWMVYDELVDKGCQMYQHYVFIGSVWYRNFFCAVCNGVEMSQVVEIFSRGFTCEGFPLGNQGSVVPFSVLFNVHDRPKETVTSEIEGGLQECQEDELFDPFKEICRKLICSDGMMASNHTCTDIYKSAKGVGYRIRFKVFPDAMPLMLPKPSIDSLWTAYVGHVDEQTSDLIWELSPIFLALKGDVCYEGIADDFGALVDHLDVVLDVVVGEDVLPEEADKSLKQMIRSMEPWSELNVFWLAQDATGTLFRDADLPENLTCDNFTSTLTDCMRSESVPSEYKNSATVYIAVGKLSRCNKIELETDEYSIDTDSQELTLSWSNETLGKSDYLEIKNSIHICVNYSGWYEVENEVNSTISENYDDLERWFTVICLPLSLAGLVVTFLVCICSKSRQTIPGKITLVVVATVFTAQLLFFVSGYIVGFLWPCRLLGLAIHFFWLSVFALKNVAAYHMYAVFINPFRHTNDSQTRTLLLYSAYGFGIPLLIVGVYTMTRTLHSGSDQMGYGDAVCFLSRPLDVGLALGLPVGIVLVSNTYFFARAVHAIRQMSEIEKNSNRSNSSHTSLYIKMSLVLGFTWIVGFLANIINHQYLWYAFILLNGGTGIFICLSQTCNTHVISCLWRPAPAFTFTSGSTGDSKQTTVSFLRK